MCAESTIVKKWNFTSYWVYWASCRGCRISYKYRFSRFTSSSSGSLFVKRPICYKKSYKKLILKVVFTLPLKLCHILRKRLELNRQISSYFLLVFLLWKFYYFYRICIHQKEKISDPDPKRMTWIRNPGLLATYKSV